MKFLFGLLLVSSFAFADCPQLYPDHKPFNIPNTTELCNSFYVSDYDTINHKVIAVSELLKHNSPVGSVKRTNNFHSDDRVGFVPNNRQYLKTHYDKGHMAPADDASSLEEMKETFLLTNMTPQSPTLNRVEWKLLEEKVRSIFDSSKTDVYVVTIAVYENKQTINGLPIPSGYWKIVYADNSQYFFYADNNDDAVVVQRGSVALPSLFK
jgi:endonuclease G